MIDNTNHSANRMPFPNPSQHCNAVHGLCPRLELPRLVQAGLEAESPSKMGVPKPAGGLVVSKATMDKFLLKRLKRLRDFYYTGRTVTCPSPEGTLSSTSDGVLLNTGGSPDPNPSPPMA